MVEIRCLLARRRRSGEITASVEEAAFARFREDVDRADLLLHPLEDRTLGAALALIGRLDPCPLRTL
jgi:hypothetical protein